jgi:hypothetical protein
MTGLSRLRLIAVVVLFNATFEFSLSSHAFDVFPEFHGLSESDLHEIEGARLIDSEYQSDYLTYLTPLKWDRDLFTAKSALDFSLGSLSNTHFMERTRLRAIGPLIDSSQSCLEFRFTFLNERDHETDQAHAIFELVKNFTPKFALSLYGEPSYYKRENDLGIALLLMPNHGHEIRWFLTWVDLTRELHNDQPDFFTRGHEPFLTGIIGRCHGCFGGKGDWLEYFFRWQNPTEWQRPLEKYTYKSTSDAFGLSFIINDTNLRFQYTRSNEANIPHPDLNRDPQGMDHRRLELLLTHEWRASHVTQAKLRAFEPGFGWFYRDWTSLPGEHLTHRNLMPFIWFHFDGPARATGHDSMSLGFETTVFSSNAESSLAAKGLKSYSVEHRANFRYQWTLKSDATLGLTASADLDALIRGSGGIFEGGHGWFRTTF